MANPQAVDRIHVGVVLSEPDDLGAWLNDGAAFDAAGADLLWLDLRSHPQVDPLVLTAALAAVTFRAVLVADLPEGEGGLRTLATIERLSRKRLRTVADAGPAAEEPDAGGRTGVFRRISGEQTSYEHSDTDGLRRWTAVPIPDGRSAWRATLADAADRGFGGVLVRADTRLLDLLRNPDEEGDRRDLQLAQG